MLQGSRAGEREKDQELPRGGQAAAARALQRPGARHRAARRRHARQDQAAVRREGEQDRGGL